MIGMVVVAHLTLLTRRFVQVEVFGRLKNQLSNRGPSLLMLLTVACFVILILLLHTWGVVLANVVGSSLIYPLSN